MRILVTALDLNNDIKESTIIHDNIIDINVAYYTLKIIVIILYYRTTNSSIIIYSDTIQTYPCYDSYTVK